MELDPQTAGSLRTMLIIVLGTLIILIPVIGTLVVVKWKADARKARGSALPKEKTPEPSEKEPGAGPSADHSPPP